MTNEDEYAFAAKDDSDIVVAQDMNIYVCICDAHDGSGMDNDNKK